MYAEQPIGYVAKGHENKVLKYELKQTLRAWNSTTEKYFQDNLYSMPSWTCSPHKGELKKWYITCLFVCGWFDLHWK